MTMRYVPPGRTSISQTGTVKVCGPHHSDICFGSVHALNTSVRGALMMRVKTISFFARSTSILVVAVIWFVLSFESSLTKSAIRTVTKKEAVLAADST